MTEMRRCRSNPLTQASPPGTPGRPSSRAPHGGASPLQRVRSEASPSPVIGGRHSPSPNRRVVPPLMGGYSPSAAYYSPRAALSPKVESRALNNMVGYQQQKLEQGKITTSGGKYVTGMSPRPDDPLSEPAPEPTEGEEGCGCDIQRALSKASDAAQRADRAVEAAKEYRERHERKAGSRHGTPQPGQRMPDAWSPSPGLRSCSPQGKVSRPSSVGKRGVSPFTGSPGSHVRSAEVPAQREPNDADYNARPGQRSVGYGGAAEYNARPRASSNSARPPASPMGVQPRSTPFPSSPGANSRPPTSSSPRPSDFPRSGAAMLQRVASHRSTSRRSSSAPPEPEQVPTPVCLPPRLERAGSDSPKMPPRLERAGSDSPKESARVPRLERAGSDSPKTSGRASSPSPHHGTPKQSSVPSSPDRRVSELSSRKTEQALAAAVSGGKPRVKVSVLAWLEDVLKPQPKSSKPSPKKTRAQSNDAGHVPFEEIIFGEGIGAGSFGAVYKGTVKGQVVAIKNCKVGDPHDADMLVMEIGYLQKLRHPRLVSFLGCCKQPGKVILLIEYMNGGSLYALLFKQKKEFEFGAKAKMASQMVEGLTYLHNNSIVHRDLKTMNIVLDTEFNCKICDFGLTITLERTHLTVKSLQGSPRYMAPEQFESNAKITEKVDIWQLGCVMLELFCLTIPFSNATGVQQIATDLLVKRKPPSIPMQADPRGRTLIHSCLKISPQMRPTADALDQALQGLCNQFADVELTEAEKNQAMWRQMALPAKK